MQGVSFRELVGDEDEFFARYRDERVFLRKGAIERPTERLLCLGDIDRLIETEAVRPPYVRVSAGEAPTREDSFTRMVRVQQSHLTDVIDPQRMISLFQTGATLNWNSMNHYVPQLRDFCRMLTESLGCRTDAVSFLTPVGKQGFHWHVDPTEVFVVQLHGTKKWTIWPLIKPRPGRGQAVDPDYLGEPLLEVELEPGDMLYVPWGAPHVAVSGDSMSFHLSFTTKPRTYGEVLTEVVERILRDDPEFMNFALPDRSGHLAENLRKLAFAAGEKLRDCDFDQEATWISTKERQHLGIDDSNYFEKQGLIDAGLPDGAIVTRDASLKFEIEDAQAGSKLRVKVGHRVYAMPADAMPGLNMLNERTSASLSELAEVMPERTARLLVQHLLRAGLLDLEL